MTCQATDSENISQISHECDKSKSIDHNDNLLSVLKTDVYLITKSLSNFVNANALLVMGAYPEIPQFAVPPQEEGTANDVSHYRDTRLKQGNCVLKLTKKAFQNYGDLVSLGRQGHRTPKSCFIDEAMHHVDKVINLLRGLLEVLLVHFKRLPKLNQTSDLALKWMCLSVDDKLEDWYKFQSCYLFSLITKQDKIIGEMPIVPEWLEDKPGYILGGWFWMYCRKCIFEELSAEVLGQFTALMYVKRAGLAISANKQHDSIVKHIKNMVGEEYVPKQVNVERFVSDSNGDRFEKRYLKTDDVLDMVKGRLIDLLDDGFSGKQLKFDWRSPSVNSCYEHSAKDGGPHNIYNRGGLSVFTRTTTTTRYSRWKYNVNDFKIDDPRLLEEIVINEKRTSDFTNDQFIGFAQYKTRVCPIYVPYLCEDLYADAVMFFDRKDRYLVPIASVHKVLEPFKCRIITAGPGNIYQLGRIIQHQLHPIIKHHRNTMFALIGRPVNREFLQEVYGDTVVIDSDGERGFYPDGHGGSIEVDFRHPLGMKFKSFFAAVDYSTSTDGIHPIISDTFVRHLSKLVNMPDHLSEAALKTVEGHILEYGFSPENFLRLGPEIMKYALTREELLAYGYEPRDYCIYVKQTFGQLMGSPISFLILVYLNAAICWTSADLYEGRMTSLDEWQDSYRPIFNGDDGSFLSNPIHYKIWLATASCAGLNSSMGKTYCSRDFIMINSEIYATNMAGCLTGSITDIFVLNPGLVKGQAKVMGDTRSSRSQLNGTISSGDSFQISDHKMDIEKRWMKNKPDVYGELLPLVDQLNVCLRKCDADRALVVKNIFYDHVVPKLKETIRPWSLPRPLGGLGLDIGHVNYSQSLLALRCLEDPSIVCTSYEKEVPSFCLVANAALKEIEKALGVEYEGRVFAPDPVIPDRIWSSSHGLSRDTVQKVLIPGYESRKNVSNLEIWTDMAETLVTPFYKELNRLSIKTLSLDKHYIGADRELHGHDDYSMLLRKQKKNAWGHTMSEDKVTELRGYKYTADYPTSSIFMC